VGFAKLYTEKTPITAADLLNDRVLPFFEEHGIPLARVLADRGTEYGGVVEPVRNSVCGAYHEESVCPANGKPRHVALRSWRRFLPKSSTKLFVMARSPRREVETATRRFKKALIERALGAELSHHLGYGPGAPKPDDTTNHRNGTSGKTVLTDDGPVAIEVPRDRAGTFEPQLIGKHERRFTGFDDKGIALSARGLTVRQIQAFLREMYAVEVSPDLIGAVTEEVMAEVTAWQSRPLEPMYPVVFFDALRVKIRDDATVRSKAVYRALGVRPDGTRDILGLWIEQTEGAKFWTTVVTDLKVRGCHDVLIAVTDGLKGMPEALDACSPQTTLQTCIVHLIRGSLDYAGWKDRKALAAARKQIYTAPSADAAHHALEEFAQSHWGTRFPMIVKAWHRAWTHVTPSGSESA
jgi:putative transposase